MIRGVWPGNAAQRAVLCCDWLRLRLGDACMDVAMIDGGLPVISFHSPTALAEELNRVLKPDGLFVARILARPDGLAPKRCRIPFDTPRDISRPPYSSARSGSPRTEAGSVNYSA
jgi:ubiquinone/menaquinone biosynthesis C-methylase UbiE